MLVVAGVSILNGLQNYVSLAGARKVYNRAPDRVSPLQSRTFGTWTITAGLVRLYAAYNISDPGLYHLAMATYGLALAHFMLEAAVYRTVGWGALPPFMVASLSLGWMILQYDHYLL